MEPETPRLTTIQRNLVVMRATAVGFGAAALLGGVGALSIGYANASIDSLAVAVSAFLIGVVLLAGTGIFGGLTAAIVLIVFDARFASIPTRTARFVASATGAAATAVGFVLLFAVGAAAPAWVGLVSVVPAGVVGISLFRAAGWIVGGRNRGDLQN